ICKNGILGTFGGTAEYDGIEVRSRSCKTGYLRESPRFRTQLSLQPSVDRPDFLIPSASGHCRQYDLRAGPQRRTQQQGVGVEVAAPSHGKAGDCRSQQKAKCEFNQEIEHRPVCVSTFTASLKTDNRRQYRGSATGDTTSASCSNPKDMCTFHRHASFAGGEIRTPKDNSSAARRDANHNCNGCNCRQPLEEIGTNSQPRAHDSMNPIPRSSFSLWESPSAILQGPNATIGWTGPNAAHLSSSNIKDKTIVSPSIGENAFRGTLREDETWAKIARTKSRRAGGATDGVSTQNSSLTSNPPEAERTKHCLGVMTEAETDAAVSACSSKQRCRCYFSSSDGSAVTTADLGPMAATAGLSLGTSVGPPSFASSPSGQGTPASLPASNCWNPLAYENSLLGKPSSSTAHPSIAGHQTSGPSGAPSDQHHIDDALDGTMSDLHRVPSPSDGDAGGDGARGLDVSTRMLPWEALFFRQAAVGIEESRPLKPAQQLEGRSGDSSRLDRLYRTSISTNSMASPNMDSKRTSTARLTDILRIARRVVPEGWVAACSSHCSVSKEERGGSLRRRDQPFSFSVALGLGVGVLVLYPGVKQRPEGPGRGVPALLL
ncbi:unnamed protein product, partial [Ectocarpus sp. 4 AP-2014]